jgi:hypothetical protein
MNSLQAEEEEIQRLRQENYSLQVMAEEQNRRPELYSRATPWYRVSNKRELQEIERELGMPVDPLDQDYPEPYKYTGPDHIMVHRLNCPPQSVVDYTRLSTTYRPPQDEIYMEQLWRPSTGSFVPMAAVDFRGLGRMPDAQRRSQIHKIVQGVEHREQLDDWEVEPEFRETLERDNGCPIA